MKGKSMLVSGLFGPAAGSDPGYTKDFSQRRAALRRPSGWAC